MSDRRRIIIDQLMFTGPEREPASLHFKTGVNIIWGASNTGKSFVRKSIDYLLGGELPILPPEGKGLDNYLLWLTLPGDQKVTLRASALGGDIYKAEGHLPAVDLVDGLAEGPLAVGRVVGDLHLHRLARLGLLVDGEGDLVLAGRRLQV